MFVDECHRSIYSLWRQVLEYFDAHLIGLTATPAKQTFGFFNQNLVMEYNHAQAVADGVNVDFDVYRIQTKITSQGSTVEAGPFEQVGKRDRMTRRMRWEQVDEDLTYTASELDRAVVAQDQIRTVIRTFRDRLPIDIFPNRTEVPKTLIYAKDDSHADDIVQIVREEFGKGNDFCEKITYRTGTARVVTEDDRRRRQGGRADRLQVLRPQTRDAALLLPQLLQPPHRRHRGHDRHRHGHQAAGDRDVHALRPEPQLLRADEGARGAGDQPDRHPERHARREVEGPLRHHRLRGGDRARAVGHLPARLQEDGAAGEAAGADRPRQPRHRRSSAPSRVVWRGSSAASVPTSGASSRR